MDQLELEILKSVLPKKKLKKIAPTSSEVHVLAPMKRIKKDDGLTPDQQSKASSAELVTFPKDVEGSNCANCRYVNGQFCEHPKMGIPLLDGAPNMCCDYWDRPGTKHFVNQGQVVSKAELTPEGRKHIATSNFALPGERKYPIHDINHARNALARVAQHGTDEEKGKVKAAVYRKYPSLKPVEKDEIEENDPSDVDSSPDVYPPLNNLGAELLKEEFDDSENGETFEDDDANTDSNNLDMLYGYQLLVEGMDWELSHTTLDPQAAREAAMEQLEVDPMHYRKLDMEYAGTDDQLAKEDDDNADASWAQNGLSIDLGSGQTREAGHIGFDTYPYDHGTFVHDLNMGIPLPDESCENVRMCNVEMEDPKAILSEIHRVLMPGGQFVYEGPNDIANYPEWEQDYPGLVLTNHQSSVDKGGDDENPGVFRQQFTRIAVPDPATANDAEPRVGVASYDMLPSDALLAADALGYYYSDATSSGRGNRLHGYPSQGALFDSAQGGAQKDAEPPAPKKKKPTIEQAQVKEALDNLNPNPSPPRKPKRISKIEKMLRKGKFVPILKTNAAKQIVYGVVLAPNEIDAQDDFMTPDDIEKAAHGYLQNSRVVGSGHTKPIEAYPVESFIAPQDFEVHGQYGNQPVKKGSWVLGVKVEDPEEWQKVASGEYTGFSVGGHGARTEV